MKFLNCFLFLACISLFIACSGVKSGCPYWGYDDASDLQQLQLKKQDTLNFAQHNDYVVIP